jgi:hypothetical protein
MVSPYRTAAMFVIIITPYCFQPSCGPQCIHLALATLRLALHFIPDDVDTATAQLADAFLSACPQTSLVPHVL